MTDHPLTKERCEQIQLHIFNQTDEDCMRFAYDWGARDKARQAYQWLKQNAWKYLKQKDYSEEYTIDESELCADFEKSMWFD